MDTYVNSVTAYLFAQSWQIALLALIVGLISLALKNRSAHIRYLLWLVVLAKCLIPSLYSVPVPILPDRPSIEKMSVPVSVETPVVDSMIDKADTPVKVQAVNASQNSGFALPSTKYTIVLVWLLGVFLFLLWIGFRAVRYSLWLRSRRVPLPDNFRKKLQETFERLNFKKLPRIWLTKDIGQPFVWGLLRGSVYLPVDFTDLDSPQYNRTVIIHELSHIIRYDAAINLLQILVQAIFWFHPVVWWVNRKIRQEREKCCDELVVAQFSTAPEHYTDAIVEALTAERRSEHPVPSLAIVGSVKDIEERIKNMLRPGKKFYKRPSVIALIIILLFAFLIVPIGCVLTDKSETKTVTEQTENTSKSLFEAIWASDPDKVKRLIANGVDVNTTDPDNPGVKYTPLMAAANGGFAKVAKVLLENGAEVNATDFQGWTALYYAFWLYSPDDNEKKHRERAELVKALITSGADVNKQCQGITPLINAITTGTPRLGSIEALLDAGADIHFKDKRGLTPLYYAAFDGDRNVLDLIIERGNYPDTIHLAACKGDMDKVQTLLEKGTDVNTKDEFGCTPLHWAARARSPEVASLLITNGADINAAAGPDNLTPFMAARKLPVIELLVSKGVDVNNQENKTKLHKACSAGDIELARFLIDKGTDVNARNSRRSTPLCVAAASDHKEVVELLLDNGADINLPGRRGYTPLGSAARYGSKETAEFLIAKGANIHTPDKRGMTPLDLAKQWGWNDIAELLRRHGAKESDFNEQSIEVAINSNDLEKVKELIAKGANVNARDMFGNTPLLQAIKIGRLSFVEPLIAAGTNVNAKDSQGKTPLYLAKEKGYAELEKRLIKAEQEQRKAREESSKPSIHKASRAGDQEKVEAFLEQGIDINVRDNDGRTPLHCASIGGREELVLFLISKGADVNAKEDREDYPQVGTPLHLAALRGRKEVAKILIANGADVNAKDGRGGIPLHLAALQGHKDMVELLIQSGSDVNAKGNQGETPLKLAKQQGNTEIVELLRKHGAEDDFTSEEESTIPIKSLHQAAADGDLEQAKLLISKGADVNGKNNDGKTPLEVLTLRPPRLEIAAILVEKGAFISTIHIAAFVGNIEKVKSFIDTGTDVDTKTEDGQTPLFTAVYGGHFNVAEFLLERGANINEKDNRNNAPLHYAIWHFRNEIAKLLINKGANIHDRTLIWAAMVSNVEMAEHLIAKGVDVNVRAQKGISALDFAIDRGSSAMGRLFVTNGAAESSIHAAALVGNFAKVKSFLEDGVDINEKQTGVSVLHTASASGNIKLVEFLLTNGASIEALNKAGQTPLHWACRNGSIKVTELFVDKGLDINKKDYYKWTPLHYACWKNHRETAELLLVKGADPDIEDGQRKTPLMVAEEGGHTEIVELLRKHGAKE